MALSNTPAVGDSLLRREYFDVLYRGLCGAHIVAAVVARGGIVADSKDGWLRKVRMMVLYYLFISVPLVLCGSRSASLVLERLALPSLAFQVCFSSPWQKADSKCVLFGSSLTCSSVL